jgi:LysR family transcriptional regulator, hydrogen peroxide-inducible genes activator
LNRRSLCCAAFGDQEEVEQQHDGGAADRRRLRRAAIDEAAHQVGPPGDPDEGDSLDAAILSLPLDGEDLRWEKLLREPILVALPSRHPMAGCERIAPGSLAGEPVILLEEGHCLRDQSLAVCDAAGLGRRRGDVQAAGLESLRQMVMAGIGIALVPELATRAPFGGSELAVYRRFAPPEPRRELVLAWRRSFPRGDALQGFARIQREALQHSIGDAPEERRG